MNWASIRVAVVSVFVLMAVTACGGGGGGTGTMPATSTPVVSTGVMTKGSVIVNGVRFEDNVARIAIDDTPKTAADLQNGMVVKVRGQINDDRQNGTADEIEVENEVRGTVQSTNTSAVPASFTVLGQTVLVDDLTVFPNGANVTDLVAGNSVVEVHGQRDSAGSIRASRVELISAPGANIDELRGIAVSPNGTTFTLSGVTVNYASATITPAGATVRDGDLVEVHGTFSAGTFTATRVDREDLEDDRFAPGVNDDFEVEGFVSGFTTLSASFTVNGRTVQLATNVRFENGSSIDLANNVKIEAEGRLSGNTLVAEKIAFKRTRVILTGYPTAVNLGSQQITLLDRMVQVQGSGVTEIRAKSGNNGSGSDTSSLADIRANVSPVNADRIEVRGYLSGSVIVADRIEEIGTSGGDRDIIQARVSAETATTVTVLGIVVDLSTATQFQDVSNQPIAGGLPGFLAAITPASATSPGTLVKVKGAYTLGTLTAEEAELEN